METTAGMIPNHLAPMATFRIGTHEVPTQAENNVSSCQEGFAEPRGASKLSGGSCAVAVRGWS